MLTFETINELTLKVTCTGNDVLFVKAGAFIAGDNSGPKNYRFEKVLLGPQQTLGQALFGQLARRVTGENLPLMKVNLNGDSVTYYANYGQHVVIYQLAQGETISVESENILAFTQDCDYSVRFIGVGVLSQKGLATSTLTARGKNAYVAVLSDGNPIVLSNIGKNNTISVDPDAVICWVGNGHCDPSVTADVSWKTFIGQASGESYQFEWHAGDNVTVIIQPSERQGGNSRKHGLIRIEEEAELITSVLPLSLSIFPVMLPKIIFRFPSPLRFLLSLLLNPLLNETSSQIHPERIQSRSLLP